LRAQSGEKVGPLALSYAKEFGRDSFFLEILFDPEGVLKPFIEAYFSSAMILFIASLGLPPEK
jgi:hypothetical protein